MQQAKNVDAYIKNADKTHQPQLNEVREIVRAAVPDAEETIAYGMPAYKWKGKPLFYFAAMKGHLGLYPTSGPIQTLKKELESFSTSKGCIRVPWSQNVPKKIITLLITTRKKEIALG